MSNENKEEEQQYIPLTFTRHSYSRNNAQRFKNSIDKCIANKSDEFISCESIGLQINTLRQRLNDALLWLCNNNIDKSQLQSKDYASIRPFLKLSAVKLGNKDGILLTWRVVKYNKNTTLVKKGAVGYKPAESLSVKNDLSSLAFNQKLPSGFISWKDKVLAFIMDDNAKILEINKPEDFKNIPLTETDMEWLNNTFTSAGLEFEVEPYVIRAVK